ncbi:MAG: hypothetical protein M1823_000522 [Watsoniomyces obsoletus]|nr:MAG: hypothetical protein M1823_000522 [Watsoniomyces obsoletus]
MSRRGHEGPMEFEWQTAPPVDVTSPFHQLTVKHQEEQKRLYGTKRPHSVFESPSKPTPTESTFPSQPFVFSPPSPVRRFLGQHNPSFTTPRKMETDPMSSGGELSSPDNGHADAEDTPDRDRDTPCMALVRTEQDSPGDDPVDDNSEIHQQSSQQSQSHQSAPVFGRSNAATATTTTAPPAPTSPGRGEVRRPRFTDAITRRIHKRRRQEFGIPGGIRPETRISHNAPRHHQPRQPSYDSESDNTTTHQRRPSQQPIFQPPPPPAVQEQKTSTIPAILTWLESHPHLPHVLSFYAQLLLNLFLVFGFIYIAYSFWSTVRSDVDKHSENVAAETLAEIASCANQYMANKCDLNTRVPAMQTVCENWEKCMNKDPERVGRARVSAHTFAEIFNSFVEPISYKAMGQGGHDGMMQPPPPPPFFPQLQHYGHDHHHQRHEIQGYGFGYGGYAAAGYGGMPFTPSRNRHGERSGGGGGGSNAAPWTEPRQRRDRHGRDGFS